MSTLGPDAKEHPKGTLRMSSIGQPCERKLWYEINDKSLKASAHEPSDHLRFLYGHILEDFLLALAEAAGHKVEGRQTKMDIKGIKGHRDCVIDGVTVDVKTASPFGFKKFEKNLLEWEDPFGYLVQLSSYVYAAKDDPLVSDKKGGAFLVIDKVHGTLCLDYYDFEETFHLEDTEELFESRMKMVKEPSPPPRGYPTEPDGKSGNRKLGFNCSYCAFKKDCYPGLRTFKYSYGNIHLTEVVKKPRVEEIT